VEQKRLLRRLMRSGQGKSGLVFALLGLGLGMLVLLVAVQSFTDIGQLLFTPAEKAGMESLLVIHKAIPADHAGHPAFSDEEIRDISHQSFVHAWGPVTANQFKVSATAGFQTRFYTDLFFEAVPDTFLENRPEKWHWDPGDPVLPIIISTDFLTMYNYGFALSQGLPQLSEASVKSIPVSISISGPGGSGQFMASVVGFSNHISSILVPQRFMDWANLHYGQMAKPAPTGIILKVTDPSDPQLAAYLHTHHYQTNADNLKFSKIRVILTTILSAIGLFGICVIALALIIFSVYLQLVISRSGEQIRLLSILGYEGNTLGRLLTMSMVPLYIWMLVAALVAVQGLQWLVRRSLLAKGLIIDSMISPYVPVCLVAVLLVFYLFTRSSVNRHIRAVS